MEGNGSLSYLELADELAEYVTDLGFTHAELMPVMDIHFGLVGISGDQLFRPTARFGPPDDFKKFVDQLHRRGSA